MRFNISKTVRATQNLCRTKIVELGPAEQLGSKQLFDIRSCVPKTRYCMNLGLPVSLDIHLRFDILKTVITATQNVLKTVIVDLATLNNFNS